MTNSKNTNNRHRLMMDALVLEGLTSREVAKRFGISETRISILRKSALWKMEEEKLRNEYVKTHQYKLASLIPEAINALGEAVVSHHVVAEGTPNEKAIYNDPKTRISAAREILGRSGIVDGINVNENVVVDKDTIMNTLNDIRKEREQLLKELELE